MRAGRGMAARLMPAPRSSIVQAQRRWRKRSAESERQRWRKRCQKVPNPDPVQAYARGIVAAYAAYTTHVYSRPRPAAFRASRRRVTPLVPGSGAPIVPVGFRREQADSGAAATAVYFNGAAIR